MKIDRKKRIKVKMHLNDISCGEVFEDKELLFMKVANASKPKDSTTDCIIAVNIENGWITAFSKYALVHPVQAKVVVEE